MDHCYMASRYPTTAFILILETLFILQLAYSLPFIVLHGLNSHCGEEEPFIDLLRNLSGAPGYCLEIGNGDWDSWFLTIEQQISIACDKVKQDKSLSAGYNLVGLSQGNMIARGLVEICDGGPPVKNYVSIGGPHAGVAAIPKCGEASSPLCRIADALVQGDVYSDFIQDHLAPSGYFKIPDDIEKYLAKCKFLPHFNNEIPNNRNTTFKQRLTQLQNLVLIMSLNDTILIPKETSFFSYFEDGSFSKIVPVHQTQLYKEDWIGLRTLDEAGKLRFYSVAGPHIRMFTSDTLKYVVPFLVNDTASAGRAPRSNWNLINN